MWFAAGFPVCRYVGFSPPLLTGFHFCHHAVHDLGQATSASLVWLSVRQTRPIASALVNTWLSRRLPESCHLPFFKMALKSATVLSVIFVSRPSLEVRQLLCMFPPSSRLPHVLETPVGFSITHVFISPVAFQVVALPRDQGLSTTRLFCSNVINCSVVNQIHCCIQNST